MNSVNDLRKEVLRLTRLNDHSVCFRVSQLASYYRLPERQVRQEFANLAQSELIRLRSWDGRQLREISNWSNPEAFIDSTVDAGHFHVCAGCASQAKQ